MSTRSRREMQGGRCLAALVSRNRADPVAPQVEVTMFDSKLRTLSAGEFLFRQGDPATAVYLVEQGRLRLERRTYDGKLIPFHTARAGETFAEAALFATHYHCDAVALDDGTRVRSTSKALVLDRLGDDPTGVGGLLAAMARQLHGLRR